MTEIPTLETPRMILRPHGMQDFPDCVELWKHPDTVRYIGGTPRSAQDSWFQLMRHNGMWHLLGYGYWALEDKATGAFLGQAGLQDAHRGMAALEGKPEIGWVMTPGSGGKGLATEAALAIVDWADTVLKAPKTACIIEPANIPSIKVAEKCGYLEIERVDREGTVLIVFERDRVAGNN